MYNFLMTIFWIISILIIIAVLMQPAKTNDALSSLTGGADDLFSKSKPRGFEAFMQRVTTILGALFFLTAFALVWISSH
ncbi:preprotein translocase subunit SecG [Nicoliella spurrieriana]|uniref:Protein-export membrane protein SecG n=1 Tax=Nicoliella spurrieriana TaxID=2925830 RepID=A0A976RSG6_9LACO|nr:preprotein translocase subunit SecG [Nicoliella spurrieriana]UQS86964.1 preprotein translocase subunit SecG [Nicoliella spurrieriana]